MNNHWSRDGIQLNNSLYFKDCYSNAVVQGFRLLGCSTSFIFDNEIYKYYFNDHISNIDIQLFKTNDLLQNAGVVLDKCFFQINELKSLLIQKLKGDCFAILGIDDNASFYRHKTRGITDSYHNALVIDYDTYSDSFGVIDSVYQGITSNKYLNIDSDSLTKCTRGEYQLNRVDFVYPYREKKDFDYQVYYQRIQKIIHLGSSDVHISLLKEKIIDLIKMNNCSKLEDYFDIKDLNQIINRAYITLYYYKMVRPNYSLYMYQKQICDNWYRIRVCVLKSKFKNNFSKSIAENVLQMINSIIELNNMIWNVESNIKVN